MSSDSTSDDALPSHRTRSRLGSAFRRIRDRVRLYRMLAIIAALAVVGLGTYVVSMQDEDSMLLGTGRAGVETDASAASQSVDGGRASFYGDELAGRPTASGERFDPSRLTAAHRTLPLGSQVRVTNTRNGKSVVVRINDRGPFHGQRVIDLSRAAARKIGMLRRGTAPVEIELLASN